MNAQHDLLLCPENASAHFSVPSPLLPCLPCPQFTQIRFFLLQNRQGKVRLSKWFVAIEEAEKRKVENEVHRLVTSRDNKFTNFVEVRRGLWGRLGLLL